MKILRHRVMTHHPVFIQCLCYLHNFLHTHIVITFLGCFINRIINNYSNSVFIFQTILWIIWVTVNWPVRTTLLLQQNIVSCKSKYKVIAMTLRDKILLNAWWYIEIHYYDNKYKKKLRKVTNNCGHLSWLCPFISANCIQVKCLLGDISVWAQFLFMQSIICI